MKKILLTLFVLAFASGCNWWGDMDGQHGMMKDDDRGEMMGDRGGMGMMVSTDEEFITQMIPHHEEAIETSKIMLEKTENPELKKFLEDVVAAQSKEVEEMKVWHKEWFGNDYAATGKYMAMMPDLEKLSGEAADQAYIEGMIHHHQGAIMMAESIKSFTKRPELLALADNIIKTQSAEIGLLKSWLK